MATVTDVSAWQQRLEMTLVDAVSHGIITEEQASQIRQLEPVGPSPPAPPPPAEGGPAVHRGGRLRSFVAEAVGYVGGALALVAVIVLGQEFWAELRPWARMTLLGVGAAGLFAAGWAARADRSAALYRFRAVMWVMSSAAMAGTAGVVAYEFTGLEAEELALVVGAATTVYSTVLWRMHPAGPQQLVVFVALMTTLGTGVATIDPSLVAMFGLMAWGVGTAWALLAWTGWIRPRRVGLTVGAVVALMGPSMTGDERDLGWLLWLGMVTAAAMIVMSIPLRQVPLLALGVFGIVQYVPRIIFLYFGDTLGAPVALLITGIVLVAAAFVVAHVRPRRAGAPDG